MQNIKNNIKAYIEENNLQFEKIAVACSAGLDSMVLLDSLAEHYLNLNITVLHCDHAWHEKSTYIKESLEQYCFEKQFPFYSVKFDFLNLKKNEENARKLRLDFFLKTTESLGIRHLFMGHHLDDNVETVLFRLFRGTGFNGLKGIKPQSLMGDMVLHRPLLGFKKTDLQKYANEVGLMFHEDPSNHSDTYARNRIRLNIFPEAEKINLSFKNNIVRLAALVDEQQSFIDSCVDKAFLQIGDLPWDLKRFRSLDKLIQRKLLERFFTHNIDFLNDFLEAIQYGGFQRINFAKNKFFTIKQKKIYLEFLP